ncbi:MAG: hypothetical protein GC185_00385 [Alphaproteobacteria bacterium]|nr:hypothetical protein [Alphaproteobacteria bacterium]
MDSGLAMAARAATDMVASIIVGAFLGYWLDKWLDTSPLFMIVFLFFGFASGFFAIYRLQTGRPFAPWLKKKDKAQGSEDGAAKGEEDKQD